MAEEKIAIPANLEKIEVKSNHARRNSTGNLHISKEGLRIVPRYLRASWGSCHDFCKYGVEDSVVKKARCPIPRKIIQRPGDGQHQANDVSLEEIKKKLQIKPKALPDSRSLKIQKHHKGMKEEAQVSAEKVAVCLRRFSLPGNILDIYAEHTGDPSPKPVKSSSSTLENISSRRYHDISVSKATGVLQESPVGSSRDGGKSHMSSKEIKLPRSRENREFEPPAVSLSCRPSTKKEFREKSGNHKDLKYLSSVESNGRKAEHRKTTDQDIPERTVYVIERKLQKPTENVTDAAHFSQSLYPPSEDKFFEHNRNGLHSSRSPPSSENKQLRSSQNGGDATCPSSPSPLSTYKNGLGHTQNGIHHTPPFSPSPENVKSEKSDPFSGSTIKTKTFAMVSLENKVGLPEKINFRRVKVDDVFSKTTSPRKLGFKQRSVSCDNKNGKADSEPMSLKEVVNDLSGSETEAVKVVLKHQDVEGKKWENLINNVIEETASKLVQTKKSKVRALVDAFETVISLQDTKSSSTTNVYRVD